MTKSVKYSGGLENPRLCTVLIAIIYGKIRTSQLVEVTGLNVKTVNNITQTLYNLKFIDKIPIPGMSGNYGVCYTINFKNLKPEFFKRVIKAFPFIFFPDSFKKTLSSINLILQHPIQFRRTASELKSICQEEFTKWTGDYNDEKLNELWQDSFPKIAKDSIWNEMIEMAKDDYVLKNKVRPFIEKNHANMNREIILRKWPSFSLFSTFIFYQLLIGIHGGICNLKVKYNDKYIEVLNQRYHPVENYSEKDGIQFEELYSKFQRIHLYDPAVFARLSEVLYGSEAAVLGVMKQWESVLEIINDKNAEERLNYSRDSIVFNSSVRFNELGQEIIIEKKV